MGAIIREKENKIMPFDGSRITGDTKWK